MKKPYTYEEINDIVEKLYKEDYEDIDSLVDFERVYPILENDHFSTFDEEDDEEHYLLMSLAAEALYFDDSDEREDVLMNVLEFEDEIVVSDAAESLSNSKSEEVLEKLLDLAEYGDTVIKRNYALMNYFDVYKNIYGDKNNTALINNLFDLYDTELEDNPRVNIAIMLCELGEDELLDYVLENLTNEDIYTRRYIIQSLPELINEENKLDIFYALEDALDDEIDKLNKNDINYILKNYSNRNKK